jgi:outer membrane protein assembly factor BamD (BamD/ComL family)
MKKVFQIVMLAVLAFGMMACGEKKLTQDDLKKAESTLVDEQGNLNKEAVPAVVEKFCKFVEQNPDDATAPQWLFKALQIEIKTEESEKAIEICNKLVEEYPDYEYTPAALVMTASEVYDSQMHDIDKARATYEKVISDYPDSDWAKNAEKMIEFLGLTPEEILSKIVLSNMEVEEGEL